MINSSCSFVLAATEHLHGRIAKLNGRIRQLEDALASSQAKHSSERHPLLHRDLLASNDEDRDGEEPGGIETPSLGKSPDVIDAFGTLSISDHGISRFFGPTGGSEVRVTMVVTIVQSLKGGFEELAAGELSLQITISSTQ
jgi:hypothetical protein